MRPSRRKAKRGAVYVEALVSMPIVFLVFLQIWQLAELYTAHLVLGRAASAAARAAAVVGPDARRFYEGEEVNNLGGGRGGDPGPRMEAITMAAAMVIGASPSLRLGPVEVLCGLEKFDENAAPDALPEILPLEGKELEDPHATIEAEVHAEFPCPLAFLSAVCLGEEVLEVRAIGTFVYQGAGYDYGFGDGEGI
jgi:hypothetical protein